MSEISLRDVMRTFPQGVVVVTSKGDDGPRGITVSSFTSVSLDPETVLVCIMKESQAHAPISKGRFLVNVLASDQGKLSDHFATPNLSSEEQFASVGTFEVAGIPRLEGCLGYLDCRVSAEVEQGTHTIFFGEVTRAELGKEGMPLIFCGRQYFGLGEAVHER